MTWSFSPHCPLCGLPLPIQGIERTQNCCETCDKCFEIKIVKGDQWYEREQRAKHLVNLFRLAGGRKPLYNVRGLSTDEIIKD